MTVKKIPIDELIDILSDLYEKGIDYIDLVGSADDNRISIIFSKDYLCEEAREDIDEIAEDLTIEISEDLFITGKLSDEDLNELI